MVMYEIEAPVESMGNRSVSPAEAKDDIFKRKTDRLLAMLRSRSHKKECYKAIEELIEYLPGLPTPQKLALIDEASEKSRQFTFSYYRPVLEVMLSVGDDMIVTWIDAGPAEETLNVLIESIKALPPSKRRDDQVDLIGRLIESDAFVSATLRPCFCALSLWQWEEDWLHPVASLPDVLGNVLQSYLTRQLSPFAYCRTLAIQLGRCLFILSEAMKHSVSVKVEPLARFVAHLCSKFSAKDVLDPLVELVNTLTRTSFIARRIWAALMHSLDDRCLEQVLTHLSQWCQSTETFHRLAGVAPFPLNERWRRLLCSKLLFLRGFTNPRIGCNIVSFLAKDPATLTKVGCEMLKVWSEKNALLLTSPEQHEFVTQCLIMALHRLKVEDVAEQRLEWHRILSDGVGHHLESPDLSIRIIGMVVAELCTRIIQPDTPGLHFQYDKSHPLVQKLQSLQSFEDNSNSCEPEDFELFIGKMKASTISSQTSKKTVKPAPSPSRKETTVEERAKRIPEEELDSDDDLEPYDMSEDTEEPKYEAPHYIRDMMEMLGNVHNEAEEHEKQRLALSVSEKIIREQLPREHPSLAKQLLAVLINLQNKYSLPDFYESRRRSLIAVAVSQPTESAEHLGREFYQANYSVVQRIDMLHAINAAAQELSSNPLLAECTPKAGQSKREDWRCEVEQRIERKTRRFFPHSSRLQDPVTFQNRFTPFAGAFFFPLAEKLDRRLVHLSLMDEDFVLLSNLVRTLTTLVHYTGPVPAKQRMARSLLNAVWVLRLHKEVAVREAALTAFIQSLLALSSHQLVANHSLEICEWKDWLIETKEQDPATSVRELASQAASLLAHLLHSAEELAF